MCPRCEANPLVWVDPRVRPADRVLDGAPAPPEGHYPAHVCAMCGGVYYAPMGHRWRVVVTEARTSPAVLAYRKVIDEWMAARGGVDGDWLSPAGESAWTARADEIWRGLSEEEQDEAERLGKVKAKDGSE